MGGPASRRIRVLRVNIVVLCATIFVAVTSIYSWMRVAPVYMRDSLGAGDETVGLAFMILTLGFRGMQVVGGWLSDKVGRKAMLVAGTLGMAPFYWLASEAGHWSTFVASLGACWTIGSLQWPSFLAMITESAGPGGRGRALGWLEFCGIGGVVLGLGAGWWLLKPEVGWTVPDLLRAAAVVYVVVGLVRLALLRETRGTVEAAEPAGARGGVVLALAVGIAGMAAYLLTWDGPFPAMYLHDAFALDKSAINWNMAACGLTAMATSLVAGALLDRFGPTRVMAAAFALWIPAIAAWFGLGQGGYALIIALLFPVELFYLAFMRLSTTVGGAGRRGLFVGLFGSVSSVAAAPALLWGGALYERTGFAGPMTLAGAACGVGLVLTLVLASRRAV